MKYRVIDGFLNSKTQEYIPVNAIFTDDEPRIKDFIEAKVVVEIEETCQESYSTLSVSEIKSLLDEKSIEYDKKAKKDELLKILEGAE